MAGIENMREMMDCNVFLVQKFDKKEPHGGGYNLYPCTSDLTNCFGILSNSRYDL